MLVPSSSDDLYNEHYGTLETFRPYAMPDNAWLDEIAAEFAKV